MELNIGMNIKRLRLAKGLTQEQLAELLTISTAAVSKWEAKNTYPDITMLFPLAEIFGVTVDELINEKPSVPNEDFPEVTMIGRASKKMSQADREKMLQLIRIAFPEAFDD